MDEANMELCSYDVFFGRKQRYRIGKCRVGGDESVKQALVAIEEMLITSWIIGGFVLIPLLLRSMRLVLGIHDFADLGIFPVYRVDLGQQSDPLAWSGCRPADGTKENRHSPKTKSSFAIHPEAALDRLTIHLH